MPSQPNINRGTLILLAPNAKDPTISSTNNYFVFQYNPEKLLHTFNPALPNAVANTPGDPQSAPAEFFNLTFELDNVDMDLPNQNQNSTGLGLHPALAMLELMMQPQVVGKQSSLPIVVFKWGAKRTVPVHVVSMEVEEKLFDITLNPTRATVSLTLRVLNAAEINGNPGARSVFVNHQNTKTGLVDAYKLQTSQGSPAGGIGATGLAGSKGAAASVNPKKQKISA